MNGSLYRLFYFVVLIFLIGSRTAEAITQVSIDLNPTSGTVTDKFVLQIMISGDNPDEMGSPEFRENDHFSLSRTGVSRQTTIVNGQQTQTVVYSYKVIPDPNLPPGRYPVPAGKLGAGSRQVYLKQPELTIVAKSPPHPEEQPERGAGLDFVQHVDNLEPFVNQQVLYRAEVVATIPMNGGELSDIPFDGFWHESFGKMREIMRVIGNRQAKIYTTREALFPAIQGEIRIPQRVLTAQVRIPAQRPQAQRPWTLFDDVWGDFFDMDLYSTVDRRLIAPALTLRVKPLPEPPRQGLKYIPVGKVEIRGSLERELIKEGDSTTLKIYVSGNANLRPLELLAPTGPDADDFKTYVDSPPPVVKIENDGITFAREFSIALVPQKSGKLRLPVYEIVTFDPSEEKYKILRSPEGTIGVIPDESSKQLIIAGAPSTLAGPPAVSEKKESGPIGEDLQAQHIGPQTLRTQTPWDRNYIYLVLFAAPFIAVVLRIYRLQYDRRLGDPLYAAQLNAYDNAKKRLLAASALEGKDAFDALAVSLKRYIGDRYRLAAEKLTADEISALLEKKAADGSVAHQASFLLGRLEKLRFAGQNAAEETTKLSNDISALIDQIEKLG